MWRQRCICLALDRRAQPLGLSPTMSQLPQGQRNGWCPGGHISLSSCAPSPLPPPRLSCHKGFIGGGQDVRTCDAPYQNTSLPPGDNGHFVRIFAIRSVDVRRCDGIFAASSDLLKRSLMAAWQRWPPLLKRQLRPWVPRSPTSDPHWLLRWGRHKGSSIYHFYFTVDSHLSGHSGTGLWPDN